MPDEVPPTPAPELGSSLFQPAPESMADQKPDDPSYEPNAYLTLQGQQAVEHSVPTQQWLVDQADQIIKAEPEGEGRDKLRGELGQMYAQAHRQIEEHTSQQIQATVKATNNADLAAARTAVTLNPEDDQAAALQFAKSVESATYDALSPADKAAREQAWHGQLATDRLNALLDKGNWTKAESVLTDNRTALGVNAKPFEVKIQGHKVQVEAQTTAASFVNATLDKQTGTVDETKLNSLLETVSPEKRKLVTEVAKEVQVRVEHAAKQQQEQTATAAFQQINVQGFWGVPPDVRARLNNAGKEGAALYDRLKNEADRQFRERNVSDAQARRDQAERDRIALQQYHLTGEPTQRLEVDVDKQFGPAVTGVSQQGFNAIKLAQQADKALVQKGEATRETSFVQQAQAENRVPAWSTRAGKADADAFTAQARIKFADWTRDHGGKPPSEKEAAELIHQMGTDVVQSHWYGDKHTPQWKLDAQAREAALKGKGMAPAAAAPPLTPPTSKVKLVGPGGKTGAAPAQGIDAWLAKHPDWKRQAP